MLTFAENQVEINHCFQSYLNNTEVLDWKYEDAIKDLLKLDFFLINIDEEMEQAGEIYLQQLDLFVEENKENLSDEESKKIKDVTKIMQFLAIAQPIEKLFREADYQQEYIYILQADARNPQPGDTAKHSNKLTNMTSLEKFDDLYKYCGTDGVLNLLDTPLPKRYKKHMAQMKTDLQIPLQPKVTLQERDILLRISRCKTNTDVEELVANLYKTSLDASCKYLRFALAAALDVWDSGKLKMKDHGEDWYRIHVYGAVWDKAFSTGDDYETKRSECYSKTTTVLKSTDEDIRNQKVDFILRDINSDRDVVTVEEKPGRKGVKADVKKGFALQKLALLLWKRKINSSALVQQLESISCQWEKTRLTIYASRVLPSGGVLSYKKGEFAMPISSKHAPEFSKLLMGILSLKRIVMHNYEKFSLILAERYKQELDYLVFNDDSDITYRNDSSQDSNSSDEVSFTHEFDINGNVLKKVKELKSVDNDVKEFNDWEVLMLYDRVKRVRQ